MCAATNERTNFSRYCLNIRKEKPTLSERSQKQAYADPSLEKEIELTEGGASWGAIAGGDRALT